MSTLLDDSYLWISVTLLEQLLVARDAETFLQIGHQLELKFFSNSQPKTKLFNCLSLILEPLVSLQDDFKTELKTLGLTEDDFFNLFPNDTLTQSIDNLNLEGKLTNSEEGESLSPESLKSQYHNSIPLSKLQYPEPFIASASFIHTDIGFIHVLQYNY